VRQQPLRVWRFSDGRPGHETQSLGLVRALSRTIPIDVIEIPARSAGRILLGRNRAIRDARSRGLPDLLIGAGHATHLPMLAARARHGGRAIVLMKPSLPRRWFDLSIVPEHDGVSSAACVMHSRGVLNNLEAATDDPVRGTRGLILVGGPSRHHDWDGSGLLDQIRTILEKQPELEWTLTTSPRTPDGFADELERTLDGVTFVPFQATGPGWVAEQLPRAGTVWVGEDSVSMVFEALTAGASVGLLSMPPKGGVGRVLRGIERLADDGWVTSFRRWSAEGCLAPPQTGFNEAERCADEIVRRWQIV